VSQPAKVQAKPLQPVVQPSLVTIPAAFTERELFQLRNACRDSDNENAIRFLEAALARAAVKS
jgi:hypothetical protein